MGYESTDLNVLLLMTNTFERKIEINKTEDLKKLMSVMASEIPSKPLSEHPFTADERLVKKK